MQRIENSERIAFLETLAAIKRRIQPLFANPVEVRDESMDAKSSRNVCFLVVTVRPWCLFRFLAPYTPLFIVHPYFSDHPDEEERKRISYRVFGDEQLCLIVNDEMRKFIEKTGFEIVRYAHTPCKEEISPLTWTAHHL